MRVRITESKDLVKAIQDAGVEEAQVAFVKKRGHLHVQRAGVDDFVIHRKTPTVLVDGLWTRTDQYFLGPGAAFPVEGWEEVLTHFATWLTLG